MKAYTVVLVRAAALGRLVFETAPLNRAERMAYEAQYHAHEIFPSHNREGSNVGNPVNVFFVDTEEAAKALATTLAQYNPGTTWQWFKSAGYASSQLTPIPENQVSIKKITEKGLLP